MRIIKNFKKLFLYLTLITLIIPTNILAYSKYLIPGGEAVGVTLNSKGVVIVGFYDINGIKPGVDASLKVGDIITSINNKKITTISEMVDVINNSDQEIQIEYERKGKKSTTNLKLIKENDSTYKTGLYVKDSITGLGTLTFIDPETKNYGILGHEIIEKNTGLKLDVNDGKIFEASITGITPTERGTPGEKNAKFYSNKVMGNVNKNTTSGIFGKYTSSLPDKEKIEIASPDEVKIGNAKMLTAINENEVKEFNINITKINKNPDKSTKNLLFEITDEELLEKTGGIIQGMSGSPIIQNNKIIGAVTHVVVDNPTIGYAIFITNMLKEAEK